MNRQIARILLAFALGLMLAFSARAFVIGDADIDSGTNDIRAQQGLPPITTSNLLTELAYARAAETVSDFSHDFWWWEVSGCAGIGENLAYTSATDEAWPLRAWVASPDHYANILGDWDFMGSAEITSGGYRYAVQLFGKNCGTAPPPPPPAPTPTPTPKPVVLQPTAAPPTPVELPDTSMEKP
jgi:hypothetical protein